MMNEEEYPKYFKYVTGIPGITHVYEFQSGPLVKNTLRTHADALGISLIKYPFGVYTEASIRSGVIFHSRLIPITKAEFDKEFYAALKIIRDCHKE